MRVYIYIYTHIHMYVYIYIYIYTHVYYMILYYTYCYQGPCYCGNTIPKSIVSFVLKCFTVSFHNFKSQNFKLLYKRRLRFITNMCVYIYIYIYIYTTFIWYTIKIVIKDPGGPARGQRGPAHHDNNNKT